MQIFWIIITAVMITCFSLPCKADTIIFKDGKKIETRQAWEDGNMIKCYRFGGIVSYPKDTVTRIETGKPKAGNEDDYDSLLNQRRVKTRAGSIACPSWQLTRKMDTVLVQKDYARYQDNILSRKCVVLDPGVSVPISDGPHGTGGYVEISYRGRILWVNVLGVNY